MHRQGTTLVLEPASISPAPLPTRNAGFRGCKSPNCCAMWQPLARRALALWNYLFMRGRERTINSNSDITVAGVRAMPAQVVAKD